MLELRLSKKRRNTIDELNRISFIFLTLKLYTNEGNYVRSFKMKLNNCFAPIEFFSKRKFLKLFRNNILLDIRRFIVIFFREKNSITYLQCDLHD